jgi:hypothetical protein
LFCYIKPMGNKLLESIVWFFSSVHQSNQCLRNTKVKIFFFMKLNMSVYSLVNNMKYWAFQNEHSYWIFSEIESKCNLNNDIVQFQHLLFLHNAFSSTSNLCYFLNSLLKLYHFFGIISCFSTEESTFDLMM